MTKKRQQIGRVIRDYREAKGLSEESLGLMVGVSQQQIDRYEHGKTAINIDNLLKISEILGIPMNKYFDDVKTNDSMIELKNEIMKHKEIFDILKKHSELNDIIKLYNKSYSDLENVNVFKLLTKLASYPADKKQTALNIIMKGKL